MTLWVPPGAAYPTGERTLPPAADIVAPSGLRWHYVGEHRDLLAPGTLASGWWVTGHREGLAVCVSIDDTAKWGPMLHLSISHRARHPSWDEIHEARDLFLPEFREFMLVLPRRGEYVNVHEHCFHLHEVPEELAG